MKEINWLHFSDLHVGTGSQSWMWPQLKLKLFDDLKKQYLITGPWDLVFFTGDLTSSGSEFSDLEKILHELWQEFEQLGCEPKLAVVPGNHDLSRPVSHNATAKVLKNWQNEKDIQALFWETENNEYKKLVKKMFSNYVNWTKTTTIPMIPHKLGAMPGDLSAQITLNEVKLGIVGLNTSFLQFCDSFKENTLELHQIQLNTVLDSQQGKWLKDNDFSILLTHHDADWLNFDSKKHYNTGICPPDSFTAHLCGHLHESKSTNTSDGGASARLVLRAASLFGLEKWGEINDRILGYSSGKLIIDGDTKILKLWPRKLVDKIAGNYKIEVDQRYETSSEAMTIYLNAPLDIEVMPLSVVSSPNDVINLTETNKLQSIPKFPIFLEKQHQSVRDIERESLCNILKKDRCGWVFADWGLGKEGFVRSVLYEITSTMASDPIVILLPCDEMESFENILDLVEEVCNMPLQELCHQACDRQLYLIFDNLSSGVSNKMNVQKLDNLFQTILDFDPNFVVIAVNRIPIKGSKFVGAELRALSIPELREYIISHSKNTLKSIELEYVERIHTMSQGLPLYVDYVLKLLDISSLDDLYEMDFTFSIKSIENEERMPHGLVQVISQLQNDKDEYVKRSYEMLKVLSVLANGETFVKIKHFYHAKPFYLTNVDTLVDLGLLNAIPVYNNTDGIVPKQITHGDHNVSKLLRVPRQVRDYVKSLLPEEEVSKIIEYSADFLFGPHWRTGKLNFSGGDPFNKQGAKSIGLGNEHIVAKTLIWFAIEKNDRKALKQASLLALSYCNQLARDERFRDAAVAAEEICHFLNDQGEVDNLLRLKLALGKALRMLSKTESALAIFKSLAQEGAAKFSKDELADVYLNMALIEEKKENKEEAITAAKMAQKVATKGSSDYNQATTIIINFMDDEVAKEKQLHQLEVKCRNKKQMTVANNICLDQAYKAKDDKKLFFLDSVINCQSEDNYNKVRAIVSKVKYLATPHGIEKITNKDCLNISIAYSYLFSQRFNSLFNQCHEAIWKLLKQDKQFDKMMRLFMHSSFLWRIKGDLQKETQYINELEQLHIDMKQVGSKEYAYFRLRLANTNC